MGVAMIFVNILVAIFVINAFDCSAKKNILNSRLGGYPDGDGDFEIVIIPQKLESRQNKIIMSKKNVDDESPNYTYVNVFSIKPEMARNLAIFGRPFRSSVRDRSKSSTKNEQNKWRGLDIPAW